MVQQVDPQLIDQTRREIGQLIIEIEQLAGQDIDPGEFYAEYLRRVASAIAARASALWLKTPHGNLQLQYQVKLQTVGLDAGEEIKLAHDELLRYTLAEGKPLLIGPHSGAGGADPTRGGQIGNPTGFMLVLAPILLEQATVGLVEVFLDGDRPIAAQKGYLQFMQRIAGEVGKYLKNRQYRQILGQQELWNQVDGFIRSIHGGLNPNQVAYLVANESRKLIQCERTAVAIRRGSKTTIVAISGQDLVEKRSNLVKEMGVLAQRVLKHGENFLYAGSIEDHWPRDVVQSLERYLEESGSKLVAIVPLADQREFGLVGTSRERPDVALIVEMIEDHALPQELAGKIEVVTRHASSALYNALEVDRIPLSFFWRRVGSLTDRFTRQTSVKIGMVVAALVVVVVGLIVIPWPLRLEGRGELVPEVRRTVYAPVNGIIRSVKVDHGDPTEEGSLLAEMSHPELEREAIRLKGELRAAAQALRGLEAERQTRGAQDIELGAKINQQRQQIESLTHQEQLVRAQMDDLRIISPIHGQVMNWKPKESLTLRPVQQGDPLLELADVDGPWILEVQLPESTVNHIVDSMKKSPDGTLPVDYVLSSAPETTYKGTLYSLSTQATANPDGNVVEAKIRIEPDANMPMGRMVSGVEVRAKVDCGPHAVGYVLFHELIDFIREYVFF